MRTGVIKNLRKDLVGGEHQHRGVCVAGHEIGGTGSERFIPLLDAARDIRSCSSR